MFNAGSDPADLLITPLLGSSGLNDVVRGTMNTGNGVLVRAIVNCTQAQYNALTPDANTLYVIVG